MIAKPIDETRLHVGGKVAAAGDRFHREGPQQREDRFAIATVGEVRGGDPDGVRGGVVGHAHFRFTGLFASLDWLAGPASEARRMSSTT